jgi:chaperonin GroES
MNLESNLPIEPVGYRLLIEPLRAEEKSKGGIILATETQEAQGHLTYVGRVIAMGDDCYQHPKFNQRRWCQVGDYVAHGRYAGQKMEVKDGSGGYVAYRLLNDDEVLARVDNPDVVRIYI